MKPDLISVADAAYPFDYAELPSGVVAVCGYVGQSGETPHVWSTQEADAARKAVGAWAPIWVPPQGVMTADTGVHAAAELAGVLGQYGVPADSPMFFDIEEHSYEASPAGARSAASAFVASMARHGCHNAWPYVPLAMGKGWVAHYVGAPPRRLPKGYAGLQWTNKGHGGTFDLSVFHRSVFAPILNNDKDSAMPLDKADKTWIAAELTHMQDNILGRIDALHGGKGGGVTWSVNLHSVNAEVIAVHHALTDAPVTPVDVTALADRLAITLGNDVAAQVVAELGKRLSG